MSKFITVTSLIKEYDSEQADNPSAQTFQEWLLSLEIERLVYIRIEVKP